MAKALLWPEAGTPCGDERYCDGAGACWTGCTEVPGKCVLVGDVAACFAEAHRYECFEGDVCRIIYRLPGEPCEDGGTCNYLHSCQ
jgi:hypothetical protein